jgi:hypothetical protein
MISYHGTELVPKLVPLIVVRSFVLSLPVIADFDILTKNAFKVANNKMNPQKNTTQ